MGKSHNGIRDMTTGNPAGHILAFSLPLLVGSFLQQLYNMVDSWVVGNYVGDAALAAVGVGFPVMFMFSSLFMGLSNGGTVVIAQFFGAGRMDRVQDAVDTIYTAFAWAAVPITLCSVALVRPLLWLLRVDAAAVQDTRTYMLVVCAGIVGTIGYNLNAGILNGLGNSRTTLLFLSVAAGLNIVLDLVLVLRCGLGVFGVAAGTIISQAVSWLFGLFYINRRYSQVVIHPFCGRFDRPLFLRIMGIGLPAGIQMSMVALSAMVVIAKVNTFGKEFTAGFNVGNKLDALAFLPAQSLASAVIAFVGQNVGAGRLDRARLGIRDSVIASAVWGGLMTVVLLRFGAPLASLFSPNPAVVNGAAVYLRGLMPAYALFAVMFTLNSAMRGAGDSVFPMVNVLLSMILLRVPAVYFLADRFGRDYMFYGFDIGWVLGFSLAVSHYVRGAWLRHLPPAPEREGQEGP